MSTWTFLYEFTEFYRVSYRVWGRPCPYIFWPHQLIREKDWTYYSPAKSCSLVLWRPVGRAQSSPSLPSLPSFSLRRARCTRLVTPSITASNISDIDLYLRYRTRYFTARLHFSSIAKWFRYLFFFWYKSILLESCRKSPYFMLNYRVLRTDETCCCSISSVSFSWFLSALHRWFQRRFHLVRQPPTTTKKTKQNSIVKNRRVAIVTQRRAGPLGQSRQLGGRSKALRRDARKGDVSAQVGPTLSTVKGACSAVSFGFVNRIRASITEF